ncbi:MAG: hypothetical protein FJX80_09140, partial [Bacteroidetes bacterium]|nr:hypothetical protein [Bacteroidota bacterium]
MSKVGVWGQCQVNILATSPLCYGQSSGSLQATVNSSCGCPPSVYFRIISPTGAVLETSPLVNGLSYTFNNLPALPNGQSYSVQVSENLTFGQFDICASGGASLVDYAQLNVLATTTNILCNGQSTGTINLSPSGGFIGPFGNSCRGYSLTWTGPTSPPSNFSLACPPEITTSNFQMSNLTAGTYQITIADYNGCQATITQIVTQPPIIDPQFQIVNATCANGTGSITVGGLGTGDGTPGNVGFNVSWQLTGSTLNNPTGVEIPFPGFLNYPINNLNPGTYSITITDNNGCVNSTQQTVGITNPSPIIVGTQILCAGAQAQLSISNNQPPASSNAWISSNNSVAQINSSGLVTALSAGTATITYTSSTGCTGTYTITVNPSPTFTVGASPTICAGSIATITATSNPSTTVYNYQWSTSPVTTQNGVTSSSISVSPGSTTIYTVTATNPTTSCSSSQNITVTVNPLTTPLFTQLGPYCQNSTPGTLPTTSNNGIAGSWSPATISTSTIGTQTYNFTPTTTGAPGCAQNASLTIQTTTLPTATITGTTNICQNASQPNITFTGATGATTTPPYTFTYTVTGNATAQTITTTSTSSSVTLPVPTGTPGTYTYTLTNVSIGSCSNTASGTATITVTANQTPTFTQQGPYCSGNTITLPTLSTNGFTGTWAPAVNNTATTTAVTTLYTFTPTPASGVCATTAQMSIVVHPNVTPTFNPIGPYCQGTTPGTLPTTSNNGIAGSWSPATISTSTIGTQTYNFTPTTTGAPGC